MFIIDTIAWLWNTAVWAWDAAWLVAAVLWLLVKWWAVVTAARMLWCVVGRTFGFYDPTHYRYWTWLWIPWRWPYRRAWLPLVHWREEQRFGKRATAKIASALTSMAHLYRADFIPLGRLRPFGVGAFQPVGLSGASGAHLAMFGQTGGFKTTQLITLLGLHRGNAFIIDPKGQVATVTAGYFRSIGKKVCILDPTGQVKNQPRHHWSPFAEVRRARERAVRNGTNADGAVIASVTRMVNGLIMRYESENPFWPGTAKDFMFGVILWMVATLPDDEQTLERLYALLTVGLPEKILNPEKETGFSVLLWELSTCRAFGGKVAQSATGLRGAGKETAGNVAITIREQMQWMKRPELCEYSASSDFYLDELKTGNLVLFVCATPDDLRETFPGWFRLLTVMSLAAFNNVPSNGPPALFVLDEFPSLGKIDALETAANYARSAGIRLFTIMQDVGQLAGSNGSAPLYKNWETFIGNTECTWWLKTNHEQTLDYIVKKLGTRTVKTKLDGPSRWWLFSRRMRRYDYKEREVMYPDQLKRYLGRGNMLVTRTESAFMLKPDPYFRALPVWRYSADPDFAEAWPRRFTRQLTASWLQPRSEPEGAAAPPEEPPLDLQDAFHIFGLADPFTLPEIEARFEVLMNGTAAQQSEAYRTLVRRARTALINHRLEQGRAA